MNHRVVVFSPSGEYLTSFGRRGSGPGELSGTGQPSDEITVSGDYVAIHERRTRRVHVFRTDGTFVKAFALESLGDVFLRDGVLYTTFTSPEPTTPALRLYSVMGALIDEWGRTFLDGTGSRLGARSNHSFVAVATDGTVAQVYRYWPHLKLATRDSAEKNIQLDFRWLAPYERLTDLATHYEALRVRPIESWVGEDMSRRLFFDIEYDSAHNRWVALLQGGIVQVFEKDGSPRGAFRLQDPRSDEGWNLTPSDIAVSSDGNQWCATHPLLEAVYCYAVPARGQ